MPESRIRRKKAYTAPPTRDPMKIGSPAWLAPTMIALFVVGLLWIVVFYIAGDQIPIMDNIGWLNIIIGFGLIGVGFALSTRWR
ncbi:MAG TPA: cell division protein CrgA [Candidatus Nanopelagicales bacterium]